jgi:hypothetical protein
VSNVGYATLQIIPSAQGFASALNGQVSAGMVAAGTAGGKAGGKAAGAGLLAGVKGIAGPMLAITGGMFAFDKVKDALVDSVNLASDLNEQANVMDVTFGKAAAQVEAFASTGPRALGMSKLAAEQAAAQFGMFGKVAGLTGNDLVGFSTNLTKLSVDIASFRNASPEEVMIALGAALRGEAEPARRFGILLDDMSLRAEALRLGLIKTTKDALTPQQRVLAANALIMKQTSDAQGDFARTSSGLANQQRILSAQWDDLKTKIGQFFLPVVTKATTFMTGLFDTFSSGGGKMKPFVDALGSIRTAFNFLFGTGGETQSVEAFGGAMDSAFGSTYKFVGPFTDLGKAILSIKDSAQTAFKSFTTAFGPVKPIIDDLKKVFVERFQVIAKILHDLAPAFDGLKEKVGPLFTTIGEAARSFADAIGPTTHVITVVLEKLWDLLGPTVVSIVSHVFGAVVDVLKGAFTIIKGIFEIITGLFTGDWAKLWQGVQDVFGGAWEIIKGVLGAALGIIWDLIKRVFGGIGSWLADKWNEIVKGVTDAWNTVKDNTVAAWNAAVDFVKTGINNFVTNIKALPGRVQEFVSQVVGHLKDMGTRALDAISSLPGKFMDFAGNIIDGFVQGIRNTAGRVIQAIKTYVLDKLPGFVKDFFGINSPSTMFAEFGGYLMQGLAKGIREDASTVMRTVRAVADGIANTNLALPVPQGGVAGALAAAGAGASGKTLNYYAAPGSGLSAEEDLFAAADRTRMVW